MNPEMSQYFHEHLYMIIAIWGVLSILFAVIVFFVGIKRGKRNLGLIGATVTFFLGILSPFLGLISAAAFVSAILIKSGKAGPADLPGQQKDA
jgi:hypothetical protein